MKANYHSILEKAEKAQYRFEKHCQRIEKEAQKHIQGNLKVICDWHCRYGLCLFAKLGDKVYALATYAFFENATEHPYTNEQLKQFILE